MSLAVPAEDAALDDTFPMSIPWRRRPPPPSAAQGGSHRHRYKTHQCSHLYDPGKGPPALPGSDRRSPGASTHCGRCPWASPWRPKRKSVTALHTAARAAVLSVLPSRGRRACTGHKLLPRGVARNGPASRRGPGASRRASRHCAARPPRSRSCCAPRRRPGRISRRRSGLERGPLALGDDHGLAGRGGAGHRRGLPEAQDVRRAIDQVRSTQSCGELGSAIEADRDLVRQAAGSGGGQLDPERSGGVDRRDMGSGHTGEEQGEAPAGHSQVPARGCFGSGPHRLSSVASWRPSRPAAGARPAAPRAHGAQS